MTGTFKCSMRYYSMYTSHQPDVPDQDVLRISKNNSMGRVCLLDMTNINDSYLLSAATTAANVLFVLFIISLFVVGSMTGVYLYVCTVFHVSLRVHLSLYLQYLLQQIFLILTPRETLSLFSFPLSTLLHFKNFKKIYEIFPKFFLEIQTIKKYLTSL